MNMYYSLFLISKWLKECVTKLLKEGSFAFPSVPDQYKTRKMRESAVEKNPYAFEHQDTCKVLVDWRTWLVGLLVMQG